MYVDESECGIWEIFLPSIIYLPINHRILTPQKQSKLIRFYYSSV